jgi:hypothetical protein
MGDDDSKQIDKNHAALPERHERFIAVTNVNSDDAGLLGTRRCPSAVWACDAAPRGVPDTAGAPGWHLGASATDTLEFAADRTG